jgi:hypothetical protein
MSITKEPEAVEAFIGVREIIEVETNEEEENISIDVGRMMMGQFISKYGMLATQAT